MMTQKVRELCFEAEWEGTIYQIVRLWGGRHAFTWGSPGHAIGNYIPSVEIDTPTAERGTLQVGNYADARSICHAWAEGLERTDPEASRRILAALDEPTY